MTTASASSTSCSFATSSVTSSTCGFSGCGASIDKTFKFDVVFSLSTINFVPVILDWYGRFVDRRVDTIFHQVFAFSASIARSSLAVIEATSVWIFGSPLSFFCSPSLLANLLVDLSWVDSCGVDTIPAARSFVCRTTIS